MGKVESQSQVLPLQHLWTLNSAARLCVPGPLTKRRDLGTDGLEGRLPSYMCDEIKPANDGNPSHRGTERSFQVRNYISYHLLQFKIQFPMVALNLKEKKSNISIQYAVSSSPCWKQPVESECLKNQAGVWTFINIKAHFPHLGWLVKKEITLLCTQWDTQVWEPIIPYQFPRKWFSLNLRTEQMKIMSLQKFESLQSAVSVDWITDERGS